MLFNLIPLAPLDGDKIVEYFAPPALARVMSVIRPYGALILIGLLIIPSRLGLDVFSLIMNPALPNLLYLLLGGR